MKSKNFPTAKEADVALLLEGSYPFVSGGMSVWMQQIIRAFPDIRFAVIFLGTSEEDYNELKYKLPENVVHLEMRFLFPRGKAHKTERKKREKFKKIYGGYLSEWLSKNEKFKQEDLDFFIDPNTAVSPSEFFKSESSWQHLVDKYMKYSSNLSFVNYFWSTFGLESPVWEVLSTLESFIKVKIVHTMSTGFAGFLGALLNYHYHYPLVISEHGIYTRERRIELWRQRIEEYEGKSEYLSLEMNYLQNLQIRFFEMLSQAAYDDANTIVSLYLDAQKIQIEEGADPKKTIIIPNGINIDRYKILREKRSEKVPPVICYIGRLAPIKDIKTFIYSVNIMAKKRPDIEGWLIGSAEEDPDYLQECKNIVAVLGLEKNIKFLGWQKVDDYLDKIGLVILSSVSEGMPLILLEAFASGVPAVTTDVGACHNLIYGASDEDKKIGAAGAVVSLSNPSALARESLKLLNDEKEWRRAQQSAMTRVEKYYNEKLMFERYRAIYIKV